MTRERLLCCYCGEPIRRQPRDPGDGYTQHTDVATGIERAWHMRCAAADDLAVRHSMTIPQAEAALERTVEAAYGGGLTAFQVALNAAKHSIAMGMALPAEEREAFRSIVGKALDAQRQG